MRLRVVVLAVAVLAAACGGGDAADVDAGQADGTALPEVVAERLRWSPPRVAPSVAVNGDLLMAVGGLDEASDGTSLHVADDALLVDLASGEVEELPAPRADLPVEVLGVTADADGFVVLGRRCDAGDAFPQDGRACLPGNGVAFRWDPGRRDWTELVLPEDVSPPGADGVWTFQLVGLGTDEDGAAFATARAGNPAERGPLAVATIVLSLRGERWDPIARTEAQGATASCVTADEYVVLTNQAPTASGPAPESPTPVEGPSDHAAVALYTVPHDGGELQAVDLPALDTSFGGVSVQLACDRAGPYLTSSSPQEGADMRLFARRNGEWVEVSRDWGTAIAVRTASSTDGVAVIVEQVADREGQVAYTVGSDDAEARPAGQGYTDRLLVPAGGRTGWLAVGPLADLATTSDLEANSTGDGPLTVTELAP